MSAPSRGAFEIVRDFAAGAERLHGIATDWREGQFRAGDMSNTENTVEGLRALLRELRVSEGRT